MEQITWDDFARIDIRTGIITEAMEFPKARKPSYRLKIDFGKEIGSRQSSAQITTHYDPDSLIGKPVVAVVNFPPKRIADFTSECLVLGVYAEDESVILLQPDKPVPPGMKIG